jgi:hypothetical protein
VVFVFADYALTDSDKIIGLKIYQAREKRKQNALFTQMMSSSDLNSCENTFNLTTFKTAFISGDGQLKSNSQ